MLLMARSTRGFQPFAHLVEGNCVDLTTRIRPFLTAAGLDVPDAIVPPGTHTLRIDLKDSDGRLGSLNFTLNVVP